MQSLDVGDAPSPLDIGHFGQSLHQAFTEYSRLSATTGSGALSHSFKAPKAHHSSSSEVFSALKASHVGFQGFQKESPVGNAVGITQQQFSALLQDLALLAPTGEQHFLGASAAKSACHPGRKVCIGERMLLQGQSQPKLWPRRSPAAGSRTTPEACLALQVFFRWVRATASPPPCALCIC
jgi:hypothetical protein